MSIITCTRCGSKYPKDSNPFRCDCGGIYDFSEFPLFKKEKNMDQGVWRFRNSLGLESIAPSVSLGEGNTPLLSMSCGEANIWLKMESLNPTGSYKDRGSTVLVSHLKGRGVKYAIEDSSGNAGASFAAYCARGEIRSRVYVPESASGPKKLQIETYGAELVRIPGARSEAAKAVLAEAMRGMVYASHAYMPFGLPGIATISYEIIDQLGTEPRAVVAPAGHGGLLYGIMRGFETLVTSGIIRKQPYYIGVQSSACDPLCKAFDNNLTSIQDGIAGETIAEGVKVVSPSRGEAILMRLRYGNGSMVSIEEQELIAAYKDLAINGVYCEPTSALVWAAVKKIDLSKYSSTVAVITGSGYKSIHFHNGIV